MNVIDSNNSTAHQNVCTKRFNINLLGVPNYTIYSKPLGISFATFMVLICVQSTLFPNADLINSKSQIILIPLNVIPFRSHFPPYFVSQFFRNTLFDMERFLCFSFKLQNHNKVRAPQNQSHLSFARFCDAYVLWLVTYPYVQLNVLFNKRTRNELCQVTFARTHCEWMVQLNLAVCLVFKETHN